MFLGFVLTTVVCSSTGDCYPDKALSDHIFTTRNECMDSRKLFNEKFIVCSEVNRESRPV